jgi:hypothetical protein
MLTERSAIAAKVVGNESARSVPYRTVWEALVCVDDWLSELDSSLSPSPSPATLVFPITPGGQNGHAGSQKAMPK